VTGSIYVDPILPFGLCSAPKIFNAVADALNWHLCHSGILCVNHYLDDFIITTPPHSPECSTALGTLDKDV